MYSAVFNRSLDAGEDTVNDISPETISSLVDKYLIQIDYDSPRNNYNYLGFDRPEDKKTRVASPYE